MINRNSQAVAIIFIICILSDLTGDEIVNKQLPPTLNWLLKDESSKQLNSISNKKVYKEKTREEKDRIATEEWNKNQKKIVAKEMREQGKQSKLRRERKQEDARQSVMNSDINRDKEIGFRKDVKDGKVSYKDRAKWEKENSYEYERNWKNKNTPFGNWEEWEDKNLFAISREEMRIEMETIKDPYYYNNY